MGADVETRSLPEVHRTVPIPTGSWIRRMFAFAGPAYLVSVGYMDPGNWATDLAGGARFEYQLVWVLLMSNLMAVLLQTLSARLGVVTGKDLAQACRDYYPRPLIFPLWVLCEIAIIACDLAEVLGAAIGLKLLFGLPLLAGVLITGLDVAVAARAVAPRHAPHGGVHHRAGRHHRWLLRDRDGAVPARRARDPRPPRAARRVRTGEPVRLRSARRLQRARAAQATRSTSRWASSAPR